jgi:ribosomal-protein-alanine N-acetyltransferase
VSKRSAQERRGARPEETQTPSPPLPGSSASPPVLRDITPEDFEAMYRLDQVCFEETIAYSREELAEFLSIPTADGVVAGGAGEIAGFAIGYLSRGRVARVVTLDVHPGMRRQGLGRALLEDLLSRFSASGAREARLEVSTENETALAFYEKLGFLRRRLIRDYYGPGRDAHEMGKPLS